MSRFHVRHFLFLSQPSSSGDLVRTDLCGNGQYYSEMQITSEMYAALLENANALRGDQGVPEAKDVSSMSELGELGDPIGLESGEVQLGQLGASHVSTESLGLVLLADDTEPQNAQNVTALVNAEFLKANPHVPGVRNELSGGGRASTRPLTVKACHLVG